MRLAFVRSCLLRSVADQVGQTPLLRLERIGKSAPSVEIYAKLEFANPGGSVKDRPALCMMLDAIEDGRLASGKTLLDSTSGNTGVAYALFGAALGYPVELVMPSNVTKARKDIVQAFGAKIIYSDPMEGSDGAIRVAQKMGRWCSRRRRAVPIIVPVVPRPVTKWVMRSPSASRISRPVPA